MKNPIQQTVLSFIAGVIVAGAALLFFNSAWKPLNESPIEVIISIVLGLAAFGVVMLLTSRTSEQVENDLTNMEMADAYKRTSDAITAVRNDNRSLPSQKRNISLQTEGIAKSMELMVADLKRKPDIARLKELASYAVDFSAAFHSYVQIVFGQIAFRSNEDSVKAITGFETDLPTFVRGFESLSGAIDQDDALLSEVKRKLLRNKMANSGRIDA